VPSKFAEDQHFFGSGKANAANALIHANADEAEFAQFWPQSGIGIADCTEFAQPVDWCFTDKERLLSPGQRGRPSTRSPMMLRWICEVPAAIVVE
jgi:hypothetical protein